LALATILLLIWPTMDPALVEAPAFLPSDPETVVERFGLGGADGAMPASWMATPSGLASGGSGSLGSTRRK